MTFDKLMVIIFCVLIFMFVNYEIVNKMISCFASFGLGFIVFSVYKDLAVK